jgi:nicotinate-nucleotide--dimethylbenzimidazole phosphoribosyltransferase
LGIFLWTPKEEGMTARLQEIIEGIRPASSDWLAKARERTAQLVMPPRALGRLHDISERLCAIRETLAPSVRRKVVMVMAGDHGIVAEGVSAYPQEVTGVMIRTFLAGGAGISAIARHVGAEVWVVDMGVAADLAEPSFENSDRLLQRKVAPGTANFARGPAMTREQALKAVLTGFELASQQFRQGVDILGTGDMGIGNTTASAAIGAVITGKDLREMVGRGTGVDDPGLVRKREAIRRGVECNRPDARDGLDVLSKLGGFEIGAIAGCVLAAAYNRRPVVVDGLISTAGALIAHSLCPRVTEFLFAGHRSEEPGHRHMLEHMGLAPILDLGMRLGEGTGGALAMGVIEAALRVFTEMMTFAQAGVPGPA